MAYVTTRTGVFLRGVTRDLVRCSGQLGRGEESVMIVGLLVNYSDGLANSR